MRDTRIQKAMADQGLCSRRQAEQIIQEGRVKLNGRPVQLGDKMDIRADILSVDGQRVVFDRKKEYYYYMMNKPRGYITTSSDDRGRKTVLDLIKDTPTRVYPVGRLDKDSEGLLLFTNDGNFANKTQKDLFGGAASSGASITPVGFLVIKDGSVKLMQLAEGGATLDRLINMMPEVIDRIEGFVANRGGKKEKTQTSVEYAEAVSDISDIAADAIIEETK